MFQNFFDTTLLLNQPQWLGGGGVEGWGGGEGEPVLGMPTARQLGHPWHFKKGGNEEGGGRWLW